MGGGTSDIVRPSVQLAVVGGGTSNAVKIALAAVGGLLAVELVVLIVATPRRPGEQAPRHPPASGSSRSQCAFSS